MSTQPDSGECPNEAPFQVLDDLRSWMTQDFSRQLEAALLPLHERIGLLERQNRLLLKQLLVPREHEYLGLPTPHPEPAPAKSAFPYSSVCRAKHFREPYFTHWAQALGQGLRYHRKLWEFVFICQALHERGVLKKGARGLGFGVGREPLAAYFAARGCKVLGTDMGADAAVEAGWTSTAQHAAGKEALAYPHICPPKTFNANVDFRNLDMNHIDDDLLDFDFCWSACALEHLGSIEQGLRFIERSVGTLRPGGWAIHTTEFNVSSNDQTLDHAGTVLFRRRDFETLVERLEAAGNIVAPFDFTPGFGTIDRYIDAPPYLDQPHLKLELEGYAATSIGVIVQRGPA